MPEERKKILIVDDEENMRKSLRRLLMIEGVYEIFEAENGDAAEKMASEVFPDLILLDFRMPGKDGYELLRDLRNNPGAKNAKVISITGSVTDHSIDLEALDISAYFEKPFDVKAMKNKIREILFS